MLLGFDAPKLVEQWGAGAVAERPPQPSNSSACALCKLLASLMPLLPSQALSKDERRGAPIFAVIDQPDKHIKDKGYLWIEVGPLIYLWALVGVHSAGIMLL